MHHPGPKEKLVPHICATYSNQLETSPIFYLTGKSDVPVSNGHCSWLESASGECTGGDRSSVLVIPSSGPTICLPIDDYIQLRQEAKASAVTNVETVSLRDRVYSYQHVLQTDALPPINGRCPYSNVCVINSSKHPLSNPICTALYLNLRAFLCPIQVPQSHSFTVTCLLVGFKRTPILRRLRIRCPRKRSHFVARD